MYVQLKLATVNIKQQHFIPLLEGACYHGLLLVAIWKEQDTPEANDYRAGLQLEHR